MKKNTVDSLRSKVAYVHSNGTCYSGELDIETFKGYMRYLIKRAIPINSLSDNYITLYVDPDKVEKVEGVNIYLKQEENRAIENPIIDSSVPVPF